MAGHHLVGRGARIATSAQACSDPSVCPDSAYVLWFILMAPKITIGLPVYNGERFIGRAIESLLRQDHQDLEIVICDNISNDSTAEIVSRYVANDSRIKFHVNDRNIGQDPNMNRVFELGSGEYFRWMGDDDWLEADYVSKCVAYLEHHPQDIAVSTFIKYYDDDGNEFYAEYEGERLESRNAARRFSRMLWLLRADYRYYDPHYNLYRRSALEKTHLLQFVHRSDGILAAELSLLGPFGHIPECLAHRRRIPANYDDHSELGQRNHPGARDELRESLTRLCANFDAVVEAAPLSMTQKAECRYAIGRYFIARGLAEVEQRARGAVRHMPGYGKIKAGLGR
jgi:glycosyltransferase involved in cell wall biosynthesis